jgi:hypothetical protein
VAVKDAKMAVILGWSGSEGLSGPGNTVWEVGGSDGFERESLSPACGTIYCGQYVLMAIGSGQHGAHQVHVNVHKKR